MSYSKYVVNSGPHSIACQADPLYADPAYGSSKPFSMRTYRHSTKMPFETASESAFLSKLFRIRSYKTPGGVGAFRREPTP
jgi:hypothetical protein